MNLWFPQKDPGAARFVAIGLGLVVAMLYLGCGRSPEEPFWEPNADDSAGIAAVVDSNRALFASEFNELTMLKCDTVWPGTTLTRFRKELRENPYKPRFRTDSLQHVFFSDSFELEYKFVANLDTARSETTATVTFAETIPGILKLHAFKYTRFLKDTVIGEDTLQLYDTLFTDTSFYVEKPLYGTMLNGCVLKKTGGAWTLWKVAGGSRFWAPNPDDAPYLAYVYLTAKNAVGETTQYTMNLRPDSTHNGIQRLYTMEELPTFRVGDSLWSRGLATTVLDAANYLHFGAERHEFRSSDKIGLTAAGTFKVYMEQIPIEILYEQGGQYTALVWGMPIRVVE